MITPNGHEPVKCSRCDQPHQRNGKPTCTGHVDKPDQPLRPCAKWPDQGQRVCWKHGGRAPQNKAAAARRLAIEEAKTMMRTYGLPVDGQHWSEALTDELRWALGHVRWLRMQVQAVSPEALVWGVADELQRGSGEFPGVDVRKAAVPSAWLKLYADERRYLLDVIKAMGATEALDRQIRLGERMAGQMFAVYGRVYESLLDGIGVTAEQRSQAGLLLPQLLEREIRALTGPGPTVIEGKTT